MNFDFRDILVLAEKYKLLLLFLSIFLSNILTFFFSKSFVSASNPEPPVSVSHVIQESNVPSILTVDISGAVKHPGVYSLPEFARINDAIALSGGISDESSKQWVFRNLNLSQPLKDSQKIYIPFESDTAEICKNNQISTLIGTAAVPILPSMPITNSSEVTPTPLPDATQLLSINTATKDELDSLPGIGAVYAQKIVDNRPYKDSQELQTKTKIPQSTISKISSLVSFE